MLDHIEEVIASLHRVREVCFLRYNIALGEDHDYRGTVKNGVIVIQNAPSLPEGTTVRVEFDDPNHARGTAAALLVADVRWEGHSEELDRLLSEVEKMRIEDLRLS